MNKLRLLTRLFLAMLLLTGATIARADERQQLHTRVPAIVAGLNAVDRLPSTNRLDLALALPLRNQGALDALLKQLYDPGSANYHQWLTPEDFTDRFGPADADYQKLQVWALTHGLKVTMTHRNRVLLDVSGTVGDIEQALHVTLREYQHPRENRKFYAPDSEPAIDSSVPVLYVAGLDNYDLPHPACKTKPLGASGGVTAAYTGSGPGGNFMGKDFRAAYAPGVTLNGSGQTVGLFELDGYYTNDIDYYEITNGMTPVTLTNILLGGFAGQPVNGAIVEVSLDIEMAISMAPGLSRVMVYEAPLTSAGAYDILNQMATDNQAKQISSSWVIDRVVTTPVPNQTYEEFATQGQSFFQASGDDDAYNPTIFQILGNDYVTLVGGTTLTTTGPGGSYAGETVWQLGYDSGVGYDVGSGGGVNTNYPIPSYQIGLSITTNNGSATYRNVPDVALTADNIYVRADYEDNDGVGGTSCAAPLWAGFTALVNQQAVTAGKPTVGFVNPAIYALCQTANYSNCFHDIVVGNNTNAGSPNLYYAIPGYDLCTGWGTPAGQPLINALVSPEPLVITPANGFTSSGGQGGPFSVTSQSLTLTNVGTNSLTWSGTNTAPWLNVSPVGGALTPGGAAATVVVSLNGTASNLTGGTYTTTVWFTNLTDGIGQGRAYTLTVYGAPVIVTQPSNQTVLAGGTASFTAGVTGLTPTYYQWQFDTTNIIGATNLTLTLTGVTTNQAGNYRLIASNALGSATSSNAVLTVIAGGSGNVAVFGAPAFTNWNSDVTSNIANTFLFSSVTGFLEGSGQATPTLAQLEQYSAVLVYSDAPFTDNVGMGNVLANYVDAGGGVVVATFDFSSNAYGLSGRLVTNGYVPLSTGGQTSGTEETLVANEPTHPILNGITSFDGGTSSYHNLVTTNSGANLVASWTDGTPLVATKQLTAGRVVALNFYPPSSAVRSDFWLTNTQGGLLMANALLWASGLNGTTNISTTNSWNGQSYIYPFGEPNTATYGQTFVVPAQAPILTSFSLYLTNMTGSVNFKFYVMSWNGTEATGPILYQSGVTNTTGESGWQSYTFNTGLLGLTPGGTYVAFASTSTLQDGGTNLAAMGSTSYPYTNGYFVYYNNGTNFSLLTNSTWSSFTNYDLAFVAAFSGASGAAPIITTQPSNQTVLAGGTATFSVAASGSAPLSYYWSQNGTFIPGATNAVYATNDVLLSATGSQFSCLVSNSVGTATSQVATLAVIPTGSAGGVTYVRSDTGLPWGFDDNEVIMTNVFGTNWQEEFYETVNAATLFSSANEFIFLEGGSSNAAPMSTFLSNNLPAISNWVAAGGSLLVEAAPYFTNTFALPLGFGVTLNVGDVSSTVGAANAADAIFNGPYLPVGTTFSGVYFAHATVLGGAALVTLLTNASDGNAVLAGEAYGAGHLLFGGMTLPTFQSPEPNATNLQANILVYAASLGQSIFSGVITFDDVSNAGGGIPITNGYHGFSWSNFYVLDALLLTNTGYLAGMVSTPNVAFNTYGTPAAISNATAFSLVSAYLTGAWKQNLQVQALGYSGLNLLYSNVYVLSATNPTLVSFNYSNITTVTFVSSGGTPWPPYGSNTNNQFAMDNLNIEIGPSNSFAPVILEQPQSVNAYVGGNVMFSVKASGNPPLSYSWNFNGSAISGANNPTLTLTGLTTNQAGNYQVIVSNAYGIAISAEALLTVSTPSLVQNGGFETGNFAFWTQSGNTNYTSVASGNPNVVHSGIYGAELGPSGSLGYLSQTLPTTPGQRYLLSLWLDSPDGQFPNQFLVSWNGSTLFNQTNMPEYGWTNLQFTVMATGNSTMLQFGFRNDPSYLGLDDISATALLPDLQGASAGGGSFTISWNSFAGSQYQVQYSTNLSQTNWINLGSPITANGGTASASDTITNSRRFYRVVLLP